MRYRWCNCCNDVAFIPTSEMFFSNLILLQNKWESIKVFILKHPNLAFQRLYKTSIYYQSYYFLNESSNITVTYFATRVHLWCYYFISLTNLENICLCIRETHVSLKCNWKTNSLTNPNLPFYTLIHCWYSNLSIRM